MPDAGSPVAVARALLEAGTVSFTPHRPVAFKSGLRSPVYVDNRRLLFRPGPWRVVIEAFQAKLPGHDEVVIAGVESAGIPHSSVLAYATARPAVFVRKAAKAHGLRRRIEGGDVTGRRVILVEDMVTTGSSSLAAVQALREAGAEVRDCLAIITYGFPAAAESFTAADVRLSTLTTFERVVDEAVSAGRMDEGSADIIRAWLADPLAWSAA